MRTHRHTLEFSPFSTISNFLCLAHTFVIHKGTIFLKNGAYAEFPKIHFPDHSEIFLLSSPVGIHSRTTFFVTTEFAEANRI